MNKKQLTYLTIWGLMFTAIFSPLKAGQETKDESIIYRVSWGKESDYIKAGLLCPDPKKPLHLEIHVFNNGNKKVRLQGGGDLSGWNFNFRQDSKEEVLYLPLFTPHWIMRRGLVHLEIEPKKTRIFKINFTGPGWIFYIHNNDDKEMRKSVKSLPFGPFSVTAILRKGEKTKTGLIEIEIGGG